MAKFSADNQPTSNGRKKGSVNKRSQFSDTLTKDALTQLNEAVSRGESWAVESVLKRTHAPLKAITPDNSLDGELLKLKMLEISEFEERIKALEDRGKK